MALAARPPLQQWRCPCSRMLAKVHIERGWIEQRCDKCGRLNRLRAETVDKAARHVLESR